MATSLCAPAAVRLKARAHDIERGKDPKRKAAKKAAAARAYQVNKQAVLARTAAYTKAHPEQRRQTKDRWRRRNLELMAEHARLWRGRHPDRHLAATRKYVMLVAKAYPAWADDKAIRGFYAMARRATATTGVLHHVDHIVPIRSHIVCGLHCEANLQVIPWRDNIAKGNRRWPDMPENSIGE